MNLVVTGSSTGIGRALAGRLLARGHRVWGLARSDQSEFASTHGDGFRASIADVGKWDDVAHAADEAAAAWPHADGLVTCAGRQGEVGRAVLADPLRWTETIRTNLDGTFHAIRAFFPLLLQAPRRAKIVCFSGGGATKARENFSAYGSAKTAVVRLVETIAAEERGTPLDINAIAPGAVHTRLTEEVLSLGPGVAGEAEYRSALKQKAGGGGSMEVALGLVEWLLSPASDGISGRLLSAPWDPWPTLDRHATTLAASDVFMLRRILPEERKLNFDASQ
jgi:NAD(P)-dependent dehydrogenase (short-subunit alcohol dehydrogenase family)